MATSIRENPVVVIYSLEGCPWCSKAKVLLDIKQVEYQEIIVNTEELRNEMTAKANGATSVPQIFINGRWIGGYNDLDKLNVSGKLDAILQAKNFYVTADEVQSEMFKKSNIVPDVVTKAPEGTLDISYSNGEKVDMGNKLTPTKVKDIPTVKWNADPSTFYTLCLTDPDAPSRKEPKFREWHHWLVGNIPGSDVVKGDTLTEYIGSAPPKGSGFHRYVFLVYKQNGKITFNETKLSNKSGNNRGKFSIKKFAEKYKLGDPIAGNFYQAEWDDYVPTIYKQLKN